MAVDQAACSACSSIIHTEVVDQTPIRWFFWQCQANAEPFDLGDHWLYRSFEIVTDRRYTGVLHRVGRVPAPSRIFRASIRASEASAFHCERAEGSRADVFGPAFCKEGADRHPSAV